MFMRPVLTRDHSLMKKKSRDLSRDIYFPKCEFDGKREGREEGDIRRKGKEKEGKSVGKFLNFLPKKNTIECPCFSP